MKKFVVVLIALVALACSTIPPAPPTPPVQPPPVVQPPTPPVDPPVEKAPWETVTNDQLRNYKGAISTVLAPVPCGPRSNQPDNVVFTAMIDNPCFDDKAVREVAYAAYRAPGYTHWIMGPMVQKGYHGRYPDTDWRSNPNGYFDRVEEVWRAGFIPPQFTVPDNGVCASGSHFDRACMEREFGAIYKSPRAQALFKIVACQWEPGDWRPEDWRSCSEWLKDTFPNALRVLHYESNYWAPCKGRDFQAAGGPFKSGGDCYRNVKLENFHQVWLQETWTFGGDPAYVDPSRTPEQQFTYNLWDAERRIRGGYDEVTVTSAWGPGVPVDIIAFEYASYFVTTKPELASKARDWGKLALTVNGIRGFGDGGR